MQRLWSCGLCELSAVCLLSSFVLFTFLFCFPVIVNTFIFHFLILGMCIFVIHATLCWCIYVYCACCRMRRILGMGVYASLLAANIYATKYDTWITNAYILHGLWHNTSNAFIIHNTCDIKRCIHFTSAPNALLQDVWWCLRNSNYGLYAKILL